MFIYAFVREERGGGGGWGLGALGLWSGNSAAEGVRPLLELSFYLLFSSSEENREKGHVAFRPPA
jgi:hypothetical protein